MTQSTIDIEISNTRNEIQLIRQQRNINNKRFEQQQANINERHQWATTRINKLKATARFSAYFGLMDEPNQAPYVTKNQALLCYMSNQIEETSHQMKLQEKQCSMMVQMMETQASRMRVENECVKESLKRQKESLESQISQDEGNYEAILQEQRQEINALRGVDEDEMSIGLEDVDESDEMGSGSERSGSSSALDISVVLDGLANSFLFASRTRSQEDDDSDSLEHKSILFRNLASNKLNAGRPLFERMNRIRCEMSNNGKQNSMRLSQRF